MEISNPKFRQANRTRPARRAWLTLASPLLLAVWLCGCATTPPDPPGDRRAFNFQTDTFAFPNALVWDYHYDENGKWVSQAHVPKADYTHHCFVVARSARQFFEHARFDPSLPVADSATYRRLIHKVVSVAPYRQLPEKIVIPGYADLRSFSAAQAPLLKSECGGVWRSYFQHGHWRMIMPFSRRNQERASAQLLAEVRQNRPPVVHIVRFPQLTINHAIVLFDATETDKEIKFAAYDPNNPKEPVPLTYTRATRTFDLPFNDYFPGGRVDVYEVYCDWLH